MKRGDGNNASFDHISDLPSLAIRRPVLVLVLNLLIIIAGVAALLAVETRELPDVDRPIVSVRVDYPGASPETMDTEVVSVIEGAVARVSGILSIRSASEENNGRLRIEFRPGVDLDTAAADVREAVSRVSRRLPDRVEQLVVVKADDDAEGVISVAAVSQTLVEEQLTRIVEQDIIPQILSINGVADVTVFGSRQRMLRVVVDPLRLASYGLSVADVSSALRLAPFDVPAGSFQSTDQQLIVRADASVESAEQVSDIVIRDTIRIGDVANVFFAPEDAGSYTRLNGQNVIGIEVIRQARSNTIEISTGVQKAIRELDARFDDIEFIITDDGATFVRSSVFEVLRTLVLTISIVVATIWLFIGSFRATLVPATAIPVALIGTIAMIWLLGFSINILTLLALVLATGLVVDDAIVVLENIKRRRAQGLGARASAVLGTRQVFFAVVTTTAVLVSVFVPIAFLPNTAGRLFTEFGIVLAAAVMISSFVSLTLVPAMASRLPKPSNDGRFRQALVGFGDRLVRLYQRSLHVALDHAWKSIAVALSIALGALFLASQVDQTLLPDEDRGQINIWGSGPDGVGITYMDRQARQVEDIVQPLVDRGVATSVFTIVGAWDPNRLRLRIPLVDWSERDVSQRELMNEIRDELSQIPGANVGTFSGNSLNLWRSRGDSIEVALVGNDYETIFENAKRFVREIEERYAILERPELSYDPTQPQLSVQIDRRRAADLGIDLENLAATLRAMIDGDELIDLNVQDEAVPILLESASGEINDPSDLVNLYVPTRSGQLVPLSSVVTLKEEGVAAELNRHAQRRAIRVEADLGPGVVMSEAVAALDELADDILPTNMDMLLLGEAATLNESSNSALISYGLALLVVFLVLAAQFEGFTSATVVTLLVPFGLAAAAVALFLSDTSLNVYSQIGLILLIGLMAKNSVLLVEFADQLRDRGESVREAIERGASVRLRPIAMTIVSTVLGGLPLILSSGAGAEARSSIGWVVFGGLGLAALFTLYLTPVLYLKLAPLSAARAEEARRLAGELDSASGIAD